MIQEMVGDHPMVDPLLFPESSPDRAVILQEMTA